MKRTFVTQFDPRMAHIHPQVPSHGEDDESVLWRASQTSNRALDSLMMEAAENDSGRIVSDNWGWSSPGASTSQLTVPDVFDSPAISELSVPSSKRRTRASISQRGKSLSENWTPSLGFGSGASRTPDTVRFMRLVQGVSKQADERAALRAASGDRTTTPAPRSSSSGRMGVKQSTMARKPLSTGSSVRQAKGKERERAPMSRASSLNSIPSLSPSSVSSPDSNSSFHSVDTVMTSPEPDEGPLELMPPPPIPANRLPPQEASPSALAKARNEPRVTKRGASLTRSGLHPTTSVKSELRYHPMIMEKQPPRKQVPKTADAPLAPLVLSQPATQQRKGPPALGMRRAKTIPGQEPLPASQFRPPKIKPLSTAPDCRPPKAAAADMPALVHPRVQQVVQRSGPPSSPDKPVGSDSFEEMDSFDLEDLEKVMQEYD